MNCMLNLQEEWRKLHLLIKSFLIVKRILETENVLIKAASIDLNQCMESCVFCFYLPNITSIWICKFQRATQESYKGKGYNWPKTKKEKGRCNVNYTKHQHIYKNQHRGICLPILVIVFVSLFIWKFLFLYRWNVEDVSPLPTLFADSSTPSTQKTTNSTSTGQWC